MYYGWLGSYPFMFLGKPDTHPEKQISVTVKINKRVK
jgi:hypothetical protein